MGADETEDLGPERQEGAEIDECQTAEKNSADEQMIDWFELSSPPQPSEGGEEGSMPGNEAVADVGSARE